MISKSKDEILRIYGKPKFRDKSNPAMDCFFYKTKTTSITFVADEKSVYQAECSVICSDKGSAINKVSDLIKDCWAEGFKIDSLTNEEFRLAKKGIAAELNLMSFNNKSYNVKLKARRSEY